MKKYRLKKDTPALKAGMVFELKDGRLFLRESEDCVAIPVFQIDGVASFDEWFEEVKEFEDWEPKLDESFKVMNIDGSVTDYYNWANSESDRFLLRTGNCYPPDTQDEVIIKEQKLIPQAMHRLRMAAKRAWFEFNGSEGPDWSDDEQNKWSIQYEHARGVLIIVVTKLTQNLGRVYFPTRESCQACIDNNLDDLKLLFGVEQGDDSDQRN